MNLTSNGVKMMENVYKYDNVDNILGISNAAAPTGEIGGTYSHSYQYDELNRLISASGTAKDRNYELLMRYDVMSNPLYKTLLCRQPTHSKFNKSIENHFLNAIKQSLCF